MNDHNNNIQLETAMTTTTMTMIQALRSAMDVMLERDDNVVVFGQDVGYFGGVFRCTEGLQTKYGTSRVFDAPISESGIVGVAVGMGAYGLRPVAEIQFADYVYPASDQWPTLIRCCFRRAIGSPSGKWLQSSAGRYLEGSSEVECGPAR